MRIELEVDKLKSGLKDKTAQPFSKKVKTRDIFDRKAMQVTNCWVCPPLPNVLAKLTEVQTDGWTNGMIDVWHMIMDVPEGAYGAYAYAPGVGLGMASD